MPELFYVLPHVGPPKVISCLLPGACVPHMSRCSTPTNKIHNLVSVRLRNYYPVFSTVPKGLLSRFFPPLNRNLSIPSESMKILSICFHIVLTSSSLLSLGLLHESDSLFPGFRSVPFNTALRIVCTAASLLCSLRICSRLTVIASSPPAVIATNTSLRSFTATFPYTFSRLLHLIPLLSNQVVRSVKIPAKQKPSWSKTCRSVDRVVVAPLYQV